MHAEMVIVLIITLIVAQICLIEWKKRHYRSYAVNKVSKCLGSFSIFNLITDSNIARNVVSTNWIMPKKSLVEIYIYMAFIFLHYGSYCKKSFAETNRKSYSKV